MTETTLTPARLWKRMTLAQRTTVALAFWQDEQANDDQVQALLLISQAKKFRPKSVFALEPDRKAKHLASLTNVPDGMAARALVVYHLAAQRPMMGAFLDALGIAHENGVIEQDEVQPDAAKLGPAVDALTAQFAKEDVWLYLNTLLSQDPATWGALDGHPALA